MLIINHFGIGLQANYGRYFFQNDTFCFYKCYSFVNKILGFTDIKQIIFVI